MEKIATIAVHAGAPSGPNAPITTPIVQSTTFRFESAQAVQEYARGESGLYMYSRDENPTVRAAESAHRCRRPRLPGGRDFVVDRFDVRAADRAAAFGARCRSRHALGDQVLERTQRSPVRRDRRTARVGRAHPDALAPARRRTR